MSRNVNGGPSESARDLRGGPRTVPRPRALAYLQAGSVGPLARRTLDAMLAEEQRSLREGRGSPRASSGSSQSARSSRRAGRARRRRPEPGRDHGLDHGRLQHRPRGARRRAGRRGGHDHGRALRPPGAAARLRREGDRVPPEPELIVAAVTPKTRLLALSHVLWTTGQVLRYASSGRRPGSRSSSTARSRSGRCGQRDGPGLLHDLGAEVALRSRGDRRARRSRPGGPLGGAAQLSLPAERRAGRDLRAEAWSRTVDPNLRPTRSWLGCARRSARSPSGASSGPRRWPSVAASSSAGPTPTSSSRSSARRSCWRVPAGSRRKSSRDSPSPA